MTTTNMELVKDRLIESIIIHSLSTFGRNLCGIVSDHIEIPVWARMFNNIIEEQLLEELNK